MEPQEITSIIVCGAAHEDFEGFIEAVRASGSWGIIPIEWPNASTLASVRGAASAFVLWTEPDVPEDLLELLRARTPAQPLIAIGKHPAQLAAPSVWLPALPQPRLLASVLRELLAPQQSTQPEPPAAPTWRRKSDMIIGNSAQLQQLLHQLDQLAPAQTPVLITGESGVGKELVARALHFSGPRANEPFIAINCGAIPESLFEAELFGYQRGAFTGAVNARAGAFEAAHNGTLFLDEIGELPASMQVKMLRVLETSAVQRLGSTESKKVNFRLVTATNRTLEEEVKQGRFREDLFYRIHVFPVHVPPLRDRPEDIPPIVTHHLSAIGLRENRPALRLTPAALEQLLAYPWPGNVRELVNLLERAVLLAEHRVIDAEHIIFPRTGAGTEPPFGPSLVPYRDAKTKFERDYYRQLMRTAGGNVSLAAKIGQKTRKEIYDALKRLGLDAVDYRETNGD